MAVTRARILEHLPVQGVAGVVCDYLCPPGADFETACYCGHYELCEALMSSASQVQHIKYASGGGHISIVRLMVEHGAYDWGEGLTYASRHGHESIAPAIGIQGSGRRVRVGTSLWCA